MSKRILVFLILSALFGNTFSQDFNESIYQAYISGNIPAWEDLLKARDTGKLTVGESYDVAMVYYGIIGHYLGNDQKKKARSFLPRLESLTAELLQRQPNDPRFIALNGALLGFKMSFQPSTMFVLGPRALDAITLALEKGPDCPQAWVESGNKDYHMPEIFGGSKEKALEEYGKAIGLMEKDPHFNSKNWYYLNINVVLAGWCEKRSRTFAAREIYRKLILTEPQFNLAREKLGK